MNKHSKIALFVVCDILFINLALILSVALWYAGLLPGPFRDVMPVPTASWHWILWMGLVGSIVNVVVLALFRLYGQLWRYAGADELLKIFTSSVICMVVLFLLDLAILNQISILPRRVFVAAWFILLLTSVASRLGERILRRLTVTIGFLLSNKAGLRRVMVVGAGYAGYELVRGMMHSRRRERIPVILVDDDPTKNNSHIMGIRIVSDISNIPYLAKAHAIDEITIAMPNADNAKLRSILEYCTQTDCRLTIVPPVSDVGAQRITRDVNISDLLYRDEVKLDVDNIQAYTEGASILITGGGGTIGSELCRQLLRYKPRQILIVDIYENNAFNLVQELQEKTNDVEILFRLGSIRDKARMDELFAEFKPDVVFHAAAHKHVSTIEDSPAEGIKNNVFGTQNVIRAAIAHGTPKFVLISSDKAVRPPNVYGATKRVAELILQREAARSNGKTQLSVVRFGNVLGSNGSIIPKWTRQIAQGGPVTVTTKEVGRFFMTIAEACQLVLQAGGLANETNNGHIFILDMGKPVNIDDLARKLIRLSGFKPDEDIKIAYTGLLPGEKMVEELILPEEANNLQLTHHDKIWVAPPVTDFVAENEIFDKYLENLELFAQGEQKKIGLLLEEMDLHYEP